jgi:hypothetical protein
MKKIFFLMLIVFYSCSKKADYSSDIVEPRMGNSAITNIFASGDVSEQSAEQAKKTIFGKWDVGHSNSSNRSYYERSSECTFNYIEFSDSSYIMNLSVGIGESTPESGNIFGNYELIEDGDLVTEVRLYFSVAGSDVHIATLENIIVTETASDFNATFDIDFVIDLGDIEIVCSDLDGTYSAEKEDAMDETIGSDSDSNHYKVVRNWRMTTYSDSDGLDLSGVLRSFCEIYDYSTESDTETASLDPDCEIPSYFQVNLSTFGTYVTIISDETGSPLEIDVGTWSWLNTEQTQFSVDDEWVANINSLSETLWEFDSEDDGFSQSWGFSAIE